MGQLEKYGLYVLCLLIFLILGVTLWGSGTVAAYPKNTSAPANLNAGKPEGPATNVANRGREAGFGNQSGAGTSSGAAAARLPDFNELLNPAPEPKTSPKMSPKTSPNGTPESGGSKTGTDSESSAELGQPPVVTEAKRPTYTIRRGDSYESIARELFGSRSLHPEIARLNPKLDPKRLLPGKDIVIPTQEEVDSIVARRLSKRAGVEVGGRYTIAKGDTLIGIAKRKLGNEQRVREIKALNPGLDAARLRIGAKIRLPKR